MPLMRHHQPAESNRMMLASTLEFIGESVVRSLSQDACDRHPANVFSSAVKTSANPTDQFVNQTVAIVAVHRDQLDITAILDLADEAAASNSDSCQGVRISCV
jgi:hypothetical protein